MKTGREVGKGGVRSVAAWREFEPGTQLVKVAMAQVG